MWRSQVVRCIAVVAASAMLSGCALAAGYAVIAGSVGAAAHGVRRLRDERVLPRMMDFPLGHNHAEGPPITLMFELPAQEMTAAWERARAFLSSYTPLEMETQTERELATQRSPPIEVRPGRPPRVQFSYRVRREPLTGQEAERLTATCDYGKTPGAGGRVEALGHRYQAALDRNCHMLAWYMKTGVFRDALVCGKFKPYGLDEHRIKIISTDYLQGGQWCIPP